MKNKAQILRTLLFLILGLGVMVLVFYRQDFGGIWDDLKKVNLGWIGLAMLAGLISHYIRAWRWNLLLEPMGYKPSKRISFYAVLIGYLVNYGIPRAGELSRCAVLHQTYQIPVDKSAGTVVTERLFDMLVLLLILVFAFIGWFDLVWQYFKPVLESINPILFSSILVGVLVGFVLFIRFSIKQSGENKSHKPINKISGIIRGFSSGITSIFKLKTPGLFVALTVLIWGLYFTMMFFSLKAMEQTQFLGVSAAFLILALGTIGTAIPLPGGLGFIPAVAQTFVLLDVSYATGLVYGTAVQASQLFIFIITGSLSFIGVAAFKNKPHKHVDA